MNGSAGTAGKGCPMPALHDSVTLCTNCDTYVAEYLTETCDATGCMVRMCPACRRITHDPDLHACSALCAALINRDLAEEAKATWPELFPAA